MARERGVDGEADRQEGLGRRDVEDRSPLADLHCWARLASHRNNGLACKRLYASLRELSDRTQLPQCRLHRHAAGNLGKVELTLLDGNPSSRVLGGLDVELELKEACIPLE